MELLNAQNREEYEAFVLGHPAGEFTQSLRWPQVKNNWGYEAILSRGKDGALRGVMLVLIQRIPLIGTSFLYAPRGPVCDLHDSETLFAHMARILSSMRHADAQEAASAAQAYFSSLQKLAEKK